MNTRLAPFKNIASDWLMGPHGTETTNLRATATVNAPESPRRRATWPLADFSW